MASGNRSPSLAFPLPDFFMPFEAAPGWSDETLRRVGDALWSWVDDLGLCPGTAPRRHLKRTRPELCAARFFPRAPEGLALPLAQCMAWGFLVDDQFDDGPSGRDLHRCTAATDRLMSVLEHGVRDTSSPLERALDDWWQAVAPARSTRWRHAITQHMHSWWRAYRKEAADRARGHSPGLGEYLANRRHSIAIDMFLDLCEADADVELTDQVVNGCAFRQLRDAASLHVALLNDIVSAPKELAADYRHNAVLIVQRERDLAIQDAIEHVNEMATQCIHDFRSAEKALVREMAAVGMGTTERADALLCAERFRHLVRGDFDWHFEAERYSDLYEVSPEGRHIGDLFTLG